MEKQLSPDYNCAHFLADAWQAETGDDHMRGALDSFLAPPARRTASHVVRRSLVPVDKPVSPCVVLFRRGTATPHVGLYVRGAVLHLTDHGPVRQLLAVAKLGYTSVRFYAPRSPDH